MRGILKELRKDDEMEEGKDQFYTYREDIDMMCVCERTPHNANRGTWGYGTDSKAEDLPAYMSFVKVESMSTSESVLKIKIRMPYLWGTSQLPP